MHKSNPCIPINDMIFIGSAALRYIKVVSTPGW
jgi:hypothetical protein